MHKRPPPALPHQGSFRGAHHGRTDSEAYPYHCSLRLVRAPVFIRNVTSGENTHSPGIVLSTVFRKTEYTRRLCYRDSYYGHTSETGEVPGVHLCCFQKKRRFPLFLKIKKDVLRRFNRRFLLLSKNTGQHPLGAADAWKEFSWCGPGTAPVCPYPSAAFSQRPLFSASFTGAAA